MFEFYADDDVSVSSDIMPPKPRTFASVSESDLLPLEQETFAQKTVYNMQSAENTLNAFLRSKNMPEIPKDKETLVSTLREMWTSLLTTKGEPYRASSLLTMRNSIRALILKATSVDIVTDPDMRHQNAVFDNHLRSLKKKGYGFVAHHKEVAKEDLRLIMEKLDPDSPQQLQWLAWLTIQLYLCRRGVENTADLKKEDITIENKMVAWM